MQQQQAGSKRNNGASLASTAGGNGSRPAAIDIHDLSVDKIDKENDGVIDKTR